MNKKQGDLARVAAATMQEIERDAAVLGPELFGDLPDAEEMSRPEFLSRARSLWADPAFRQALRVRYGDKQFVAVYDELRKQAGVSDG